MAGLGKTKPGYASKGGRKARAPKPPPPSHSGGNSGDLSIPYKTQTPVDTTPYDPNEGPTQVQREIKQERKQARVKARVNKALAESDLTSSGLDPADVLKAVETGLGLKTQPSLKPGGDVVRHYLEDEVKKVADASKESYEKLKSGVPQGLPNQKQLEAAATITAFVPTAEAGRAVGAGEKFLQKATSEASNVESAVKAGGKIVAKVKAAPKAVGKRVRDYPGKKVAQAKAVPKKIKAAPRAAKDAAATPEGRRAAAKGAGKAAVKHPLKTGVPAAAALPPGANIKGFDPGQRARAFLEGTKDAVLNDPGKVAETTGHGVLGLLTAPVALAGAGVSSIKQGSTAPIVDEAKTLAEGTAKMASNLASGDPKKVEQTTLTETGLTPFIPVSHLVRGVKRSAPYEGLRASVRDSVEGRRGATRDARVAAEKAAQEGGEFVPRKRARKIRHSVEDTSRPGQKYVLRRTGKLVEKQRSRHHVSREVARMQEVGMYAGKRESESVANPLRRSKGTDHSQQNDSDALATILKMGLPLDHSTLDFARRLKEGYGGVEHGEIPAGVHLDRHSVQWILDHPEMFQGKRGAKLAESVAQFDRQAKDVSTSPRHQFVAQTENLTNPILREKGKNEILLPEERIPAETKRLLPKRDKPWSRSEALTFAKELRRVKGPTKEQAAKLSQTRVRDEKAHGAWADAVAELRVEKRHLAEGQAMLRKFKATGKPTDAFSFETRVADSADRVKTKEAGAMEARAAADIASAELKRALFDTPAKIDAAKANKIADAISASMQGLMKPPEHGGAEGGVSTTQAVAWTPEMERDYVREARAAAKELGLREPAAYVGNRVPKGLKGEEKAPNYAAELPLRKIWPSRGIAAKSGNAESSFESLLHHSVESPRARKAVVEGLNRIFDKASREVNGRRYLTEKQIEQAINKHEVPDGTIFLRTQALKSVLEGEHTLDSEGFRQALEAEVANGQARASGQVAEEMQGLKGAKGEKFAPMDAAAIGELMGHLQPLGKVTTFMAHGTNFATRTILNSPAFALIQIPQEGLPLAAALGSNVVHLPAAIANLRRIAELPAEDQAMIKGTVGSSVGVLGAPSTKALRADGYMDPVRAAGGTPAWRHAWNLVNGNTIGKFDRGRAGLFREVAADAKVQGDFRKASKGFNIWRRGANNLFKGEQEAVEAMKGMNRAERMAYVSAHPRLGDKLMRAMNDMAGNWNSFTVFEKHFAPLTVFYPFQRYSVLWMLYHFPLDHPVVATALTALGQVNAQEIQAAAAKQGGSPSILDYTLPVVSNGPGKEKTILPAGARTFPGLSTLQQAAVTGNPTQLIGEASPPLAIAIEGATGKSAYTGQDIGENGWIYMLRQAGNLSPFSRFIGIPNLGKSESPAAQAFGQYDPLRKERSTLDPFIGQTEAQYAGTKNLEKEFDTKYGKGDIPGPFDAKIVQELLYGNHGKPKPEILPEVLRAIHEQEASSAKIKQAESPFLPPSGDFTEQQKKLLEAVENAWKTGPNAEPEEESEGWRNSPQTSSGGWRTEKKATAGWR